MLQIELISKWKMQWRDHYSSKNNWIQHTMSLLLCQTLCIDHLSPWLPGWVMFKQHTVEVSLLNMFPDCPCIEELAFPPLWSSTVLLEYQAWPYRMSITIDFLVYLLYQILYSWQQGLCLAHFFICCAWWMLRDRWMNSHRTSYLLKVLLDWIVGWRYSYKQHCILWVA